MSLSLVQDVATSMFAKSLVGGGKSISLEDYDSTAVILTALVLYVVVLLHFAIFYICPFWALRVLIICILSSFIYVHFWLWGINHRSIPFVFGSTGFFTRRLWLGIHC